MCLSIELRDMKTIDPSISIVLKKHKLKEIRERIELQNKSIRGFSRNIGCSPMFLCDILSGRRNLKLELLERMEIEFDYSLIDFIERLIARCSSTFIHTESFPIEASPSLASLVGHCFGDGHLSRIHFNYSNTCERLIADVVNKVNELPVRDFRIARKQHKGFHVQFPKLIRNILILAGAPLGNKTGQPYQLPKWIKEGSVDIKRSFLQALFDDEASVLVKSREMSLSIHKTIELKDSIDNYFEELKVLLEDLGIEGISITETFLKGNMNRKSVKKIIRICGISSFIKFKKEIGYIHPDKKRKLNLLINNIQNIQLRKSEGQKRIFEILQANSKMNTKEVAKEAGISSQAALFHLKKLERDNKIVRIIPTKNKEPHIWKVFSI